jgi:hypothetical protein
LDVDIAAVPSSVLLIPLVCRVLLDVALLALLRRILHALLAMLRVVASYFLRIARSLRAPVLRMDGWNLASHAVSPVEQDEMREAEQRSRDLRVALPRVQASRDFANWLSERREGTKLISKVVRSGGSRSHRKSAQRTLVQKRNVQSTRLASRHPVRARLALACPYRDERWTNVFRFTNRDDITAAAIARYLRDERQKSWAIVVETETVYGSSMSAQFIAVWEALGGTVTDHHRVSEGRDNFVALVNGFPEEADLVFDGGTFEGAPLLKEMRTQRYMRLFAAGDGCWDIGNFLVPAGTTHWFEPACGSTCEAPVEPGSPTPGRYKGDNLAALTALHIVRDGHFHQIASI